MVVTVEVVAAEEGAVNKRTGEEAGKIFSSLALHKGNNDLLKPRKKKIIIKYMFHAVISKHSVHKAVCFVHINTLSLVTPL